MSFQNRPFFWATGILVIIAALGGCSQKNLFLSTLKGGETGTFEFPTRNVEGFQELMTGDKAYNAKGLGTLYLPAEASRDNPAPVMVILHGSGGEWSGRGADHAKFLVQHGIGAFVVDTFVSRGLEKSDRYVRRLMDVNFPDELTDAFAALEILRTHPFVDADRIGVMGYSMGGSTAILASFEALARSCAPTRQRFALHVAFYASCIIQPEDIIGTGAPIVCLWGEDDRATPRPRCDELILVLKNGGNPVKAVWYPGAAHGWNGKNPAKYYENIPNFAPCRCVIHADGAVTEDTADMTSVTDEKLIENSEHCVDFGYVVGRHDETDRLANQALLEAVETYMPAP